jgi:hypothetical protein
LGQHEGGIDLRDRVPFLWRHQGHAPL